MKLALLGLFIFALEGCSHTAGSNNDIVIGKIDSLYSGTLGEERKVWVYVPHGDYGPSASGQHYPVVYLLDGDAHFSSVMGMIQQLSEVNGNTLCPDMILVGIPNTDRLRDLTPTHAATGYNKNDSSSVKNSGGGENFTAFIEKELMPHIDSLYPAAPYRMLIGHSLGGLMVINTLVHHPRLFNAYLAIDPSMWWDDQKLLKQTDTALAQGRFDGRILFLGVANTMPAGMDTAQGRKDTAGSTLHIRSILRLADALKKNSGNGLRWRYKYYDDDNHGSVPLISEYDALRFTFNYYRLPVLSKIYDSSMSATAAVTAITDHYKDISQQMGYSVLPPEGNINSLGYDFLQLKMPEKAEAFFKLNITNYPKSGNVYDSMGDFYARTGNMAKAIENYSRALALDNNPDTKQKLEKLKQ
jgi:predicted alpha/beta superfamily hydrolase